MLKFPVRTSQFITGIKKSHIISHSCILHHSLQISSGTSNRGREHEVYSRATDPFQRSLRTRSRSPAAAEKSIDISSTNNNTPNDISRSRSRSRYRSTTTSTSTDNSISDFSTNTKPTATPILFRRRSRPTTTARTTTTTTTRTTTTTTTTPRPTTQRITASPDKNDKSEEDDESEYYYYYYDEDEDETPTTGASSKTSKGHADDLLDKSQTQRTTGLRTTDFATASSNAGQVEKGFTKRNLHHRNSAAQYNTTSNNNAIVVISAKAPTTAPAKGEVSSNNNSNTHRRRVNYDRSYDSFSSSTINRKSQQVYQKEKAPIALKTIDIDSSVGDGKWSPRAVVPLSEKIKLREDGSVQCLDKGIFPHPVSCRQFVHCAASESNDGTIRSWLYMCPKTLSFDAVGGMCNWTNDNACIE